MANFLEQNQVLVGALIGSLFTLIVASLNQAIGLYKDRKQWEREQEVEAKKFEREEEGRIRKENENARQRLIQIYQNCISLLTSLSVEEPSSRLEGTDRLKIIQQVQEWLTLLSLHHANNFVDDDVKFKEHLSYFVDDPDSTTAAIWLLGDVRKLSVRDKILFPNATNFEEAKPSERRVQVDLDSAYQREQFINGVILEGSTVIKYDLLKLSPSHRQLLWQLFGSNGVPNQFLLKVPTCDKANKRIILAGTPWRAQLNPIGVSAQEVFDAWEKAYNEALKQAEDNQASIEHTY